MLQVGDIECETLKDQLHESVPIEGDLGRSALQDLVVSDWHPMKVVVTVRGLKQNCPYPAGSEPVLANDRSVDRLFPKEHSR